MRGPLDARIRPPGSKSITNRALVCAALASGTSRLYGALASEDTEVMIDSLGRLGIQVEPTAGGELTVRGCAGKIPSSGAELYVANSGTTVRFLTAMVALGQGTFTLDGTPRMRERPISDLLSTLGALGVDARSTVGTDCPPVRIDAAGLAGGRVTIRGNVSSQFLSGLLLAAPYARADLEIHVDGRLVSQPYVHMTLQVMRSFGAVVDHHKYSSFSIDSKRRYRGRDYTIEPDASAASYFWAAAAIAGGQVTVEGLSRTSLQGDVRFCECLAQMGCGVDYRPNDIRVSGGLLRGAELEMGDISDTVQTIAAVALFAEGPTTITGVGHIRHKETDRIADLATELRKLGAKVEERADGLRIEPGIRRGATIETYNDHRMAMSLSLVGLRVPGVFIGDPQCVAKTYPNFFADLNKVTSTAGSTG